MACNNRVCAGRFRDCEIAWLHSARENGFLLQAIIDDPSPEPSVGAALSVTPFDTAFLNEQQRTHLLDNYLSVYDSEHGGWGSIHKFIHIESMDYALANAQRGDEQAAK